MTIFEFLESANLRCGDKVTQKVKHYDEVPDTKKTFPMIAQVKEDGNYVMRVKYNNQVKSFSRTGQELNNTDRNENHLGRDGVYIAEAVNYTCSLEQLSGMISSERTKPLDEDQQRWIEYTQFLYHDFLTIEEFLTGMSDKGYFERYQDLKQAITPYALGNILPVTPVGSEKAIRDLAKSIIGNGKEGIVVKQDEPWKAGHKGFHMMKLVRGIDVDLECIGFEEGTGKYEGKIANLLFRYKDGKTVKAMFGKGWTHAMCEQWYTDIHTGEDTPVGKIFQVYGLQPSSKNGVIRLPKVGEQRFDKTEADY